MTPLSALGMKTTKTTKKKTKTKKTRRRKGEFEFVFNCADEYKKNIAEDRRDSLYFRNAEGKCQRDFQADVNADKCHRVLERYSLNGLASAMLMNIVRRLRRNEGIILMN